jgi:hypothetical protein
LSGLPDPETLPPRERTRIPKCCREPLKTWLLDMKERGYIYAEMARHSHGTDHAIDSSSISKHFREHGG